MKRTIIGFVLFGCLFAGPLAAQRGAGGGGGHAGAVAGGRGMSFGAPMHHPGGPAPGGSGMWHGGPVLHAGTLPNWSNPVRPAWGWAAGGFGHGWQRPVFPYAPLMSYFGNGYVGGYVGYSDVYSGPAAGTAVVMLEAPPAVSEPPTPAPVPASPVRPQMREYRWADSGSHSGSTLALVLKDGTVRTAVALCFQDSVVSYVTPQGATGEVELAAVDRDATHRVNTAKTM